MGNKNRLTVTLESFHKEVSGSRNLCVIHFPDGTKKSVLIDCGLNQELKYENDNNFLQFKAENIDYVIVTHTHIDHAGMLPYLVKEGYRGEIICSHDASVLMPSVLLDSCKIQESKSKLKGGKTKKEETYKMKGKFDSKSKNCIKEKVKIKATVKVKKLSAPLFSKEDVFDTLNLLHPLSFNESYHLDNNIKLTLFANSHMPGAIMALLQISYHDHDSFTYYKDINILFTGDYNNKNLFLDYSPLPKWVLQLPIHIVQESTYGHISSSEIEYVFEKNVANAISDGKEVLIPSLAVGRYQEVLLTLKRMQETGTLPKNIPIYCDGNLGLANTKLFLSGRLNLKETSRNFLPENVKFIGTREERDELINSHNCKIIVTTSGMADHGPAQYYLPFYLSRRNALIHFTCYLAEGTWGRDLFNARHEDFIEIGGIKLKKRADIKFTFEFSAHAKKDELIAFLKDFENILTVSINHGSFETKSLYSTDVLNEVSVKSYVCTLGIGYFFKLDGTGLISSHSDHR